MGKSKIEQAPEPLTFAEIARKRLQDRLTRYRSLVQRHANGESLPAADLELASDLMDQLGLPQYAFERDADGMRRYAAVQAKVQAATDAVPQYKARLAELVTEIEAARAKLVALQEEQRLSMSKVNKPSAYAHALKELEVDHPTVLADLETALRLRAEELDRRKVATVGGAT